MNMEYAADVQKQLGELEQLEKFHDPIDYGTKYGRGTFRFC